MIRIFISACVLAVSFAAASLATTLDGAESYDLLFREGTLDEIDRDVTLIYDREVRNALKPEAGERDSGRIKLNIEQDNSETARLSFHQDQRHRPLGVFPASVGNPMILYFYETVVRDMAEATGGSPFYVRNRVKDALIQPSDMETGEAEFEGRTVPTTTITLRPFTDDPNRERMQGFGDLELRVTMSEEVPGWYLRLEAEAAGEDAPVYSSELVFGGTEAAQ